MSALSALQMFRLDEACKPIVKAFDAIPYLVGTASLAREDARDYRDVDVRLMLDDEVYDRWADAIGDPGITMIGFALSAYLERATGLPIDFQVQRTTEANALHSKPRNPLGLRNLDTDYVGDARPERGEGE